MKMTLIALILCACTNVFAEAKVAVVKLIRGQANVLMLGKTTPLKVDDWVEDGSVVKTEEKSFVKLIFVDKSQMNVGPNSEMKIESFSGKDSGVIDLVKGKIRSQVTKDYLQIQDKNKSKLFIKTQNAVMGVRGTDFLISTNGQNTSTVLFEGEIVFNKLDAGSRGEVSSSRLEAIVDSGVRMFPGEFSVMERDRVQPTVPSLLNIQQREHLEKNQNFEAGRNPSNSQEQAKSVVPEGLNGTQVSNSGESLKNEVAQVVPIETQPTATPGTADAAGYEKGDQVKPANGSFVHIDSGTIIAPGADSILDPVTNTYIPGPSSGSVSQNGDYNPPKGEAINEKGEIVVKTETGGTVEKPKTSPVVKEVVVTAQDRVPAFKNPDVPMQGGVIGNPFTPQPTGGYTGLTDAAVRVQERSNTETTIVVKP